jgi:hypothetical protein
MTLETELAVEALIAIGPGAEDDVLIALKEGDEQGQVGACRVLEHIGARKAMAALYTQWQKGRSEPVRRAAQQAYTAVRARVEAVNQNK